MDNKDELIQMPTLSFPAYKEAKRPRWFLILGGVALIGLVVITMVLMN